MSFLFNSISRRFNVTKRIFCIKNVNNHCIVNQKKFYSQNLFKYKNDFNSYKFNCLILKRTFKTTKPNNLPPVFWLVFRPVLNVVAAFSGRRLRIWWRNLPEEKKIYYKNKFIKNRKIFFSLLASYFGFCIIYYFTHIEETPLTKRKRFVAINQEKYIQLSNLQLELQLNLFKDKLLHSSHPFCRRVDKVATRIVKSNLDIEQFKNKNWATTVIDAPNIINAFVLPDGQIFVFSGMLYTCDNDDSLGIVLSHEIAHSILGHGAEILSYNKFLDLFMFLGLFFIWTIFPNDVLAGLAHYINSKLVDIIFNLPYSRFLETEADEVGIEFAAKSCFDVREGVAFWQKMSFLQNKNLELALNTGEIKKEIEYLSTHPSHEKRAEYLESLLPKAITLRDQCNCPRLSYRDPREILKKRILEEQKKNQVMTFIKI